MTYIEIKDLRGIKDLFNKGVLTSNRELSGDECYTPRYAVEPLLEFAPKDKIIWCPFDEEWSAFYSVFNGRGYKVVRSSLADGQDFFSYEPEQWDIMISNPPFSKKDAVLQRAYDLGKPFALLLPANSIQGKTRFKIFQNEIQMLCFDVRIDFFTNGNREHTAKGTPFGSAYFCRYFLPTKLELRQLSKRDESLI